MQNHLGWLQRNSRSGQPGFDGMWNPSYTTLPIALYIGVNALVLRTQSKNEKWFPNSDLQPLQHHPKSISTSTLSSAQPLPAQSACSEDVEFSQTPMMTNHPCDLASGLDINSHGQNTHCCTDIHSPLPHLWQLLLTLNNTIPNLKTPPVMRNLDPVSITLVISRLTPSHPTTLAPPHAGPLRLPNCEHTSWDSCKTTVSKVVEEVPAADVHSHTLTQYEPSIYCGFIDKPPLVRVTH